MNMYERAAVNPVAELVLIMRAVPVVTDLPMTTANTILRTCGACEEMTMQYVTDTFFECPICGSRQYKMQALTNGSG